MGLLPWTCSMCSIVGNKFSANCEISYVFHKYDIVIKNASIIVRVRNGVIDTKSSRNHKITNGYASDGDASIDIHHTIKVKYNLEYISV